MYVGGVSLVNCVLRRIASARDHWEAPCKHAHLRVLANAITCVWEVDPRLCTQLDIRKERCGRRQTPIPRGLWAMFWRRAQPRGSNHQGNPEVTQSSVGVNLATGVGPGAFARARHNCAGGCRRVANKSQHAETRDPQPRKKLLRALAGSAPLVFLPQPQAARL